MKVLHICPLWFPIAADAPGGIETFLARLVVEQSRLGCQCTLLASGDSQAGVEVVPVMPLNLCDEMSAGRALEAIYYEQHQLWLAQRRLAEFDVIHSHIGPVAYSLSAFAGVGERVLHTHHTPVYQDLVWFLERHPEMWFSTVSEFQLRKLGAHQSPRRRVIHNGIDVSQFTFSPRAEEQLFFIGRIEWVKGPDVAVQVARELDMRLVIAGPIVDGALFDKTIKPFLNERIQYVGVVDHRQKSELFGRSACVVLPFRGEEPFGLVTVEAMACGTPAATLDSGAMPEIVEEGVTGFLARNQPELRRTVAEAVRLDRAKVRSRVAERFDISHVARKYVGLYEEIVQSAGR